MRIDAPAITGSLIVSGSISISGSLNLNGSNVSTQNGGTVSPGTISGSSQISALGFVSASVTASSLISASILSNTITLHKGNGTTLAITLPDGSTPTDITALNQFTASLSGTNQYTASVSTSVGLLQTTASYLNTTFSASVNSRLNSGGGSTDITALNQFTASVAGTNAFTASVNASITSLNAYTASVSTSVGLLQTYTASVSTSVGLLQTTASYLNTTFSASVNSRLNSGGGSTDISALNQFTASLSGTNQYTASVSTSVGLLQTTASYLNTTFSASVNSRLSINTGSFATTGSNSFIGNQIVTGSIFVSGSLRGNILTPILTVGQIGVSVTHSMDFSKSNFFALEMVGDALNHITASNVQPGQTVSLKIKQLTPAGTASFSSAIKFPSGSAYTASLAGQTDIITFITYDTETVFASSVKNMI